ncbi:UNVERIFIED_CONTAM: hypothetical protein K2H54_044509 [Gekko kuhli]
MSGEEEIAVTIPMTTSVTTLTTLVTTTQIQLEPATGGHKTPRNLPGPLYIKVDYIAAQLRPIQQLSRYRKASPLPFPWYVNFHNSRGPEVLEVETFMWALKAQYEDPLKSEKAQNHLRTLKQGKRIVHEYIEELQRYATKVHGWPDGILAEQYRVGLHPEIHEMILRSIHPISFMAWRREAADAEARLQMIMTDGPSLGSWLQVTGTKPNPPRPKDGTRDLRMKQGFCL